MSLKHTNVTLFNYGDRPRSSANHAETDNVLALGLEEPLTTSVNDRVPRATMPKRQILTTNTGFYFFPLISLKRVDTQRQVLVHGNVAAFQ